MLAHVREERYNHWVKQELNNVETSPCQSNPVLNGQRRFPSIIAPQIATPKEMSPPMNRPQYQQSSSVSIVHLLHLNQTLIIT